ncbi:hypothetical protein [Paenibacillus amylolyticus]|uniref:hypothetical protein n=1 Tax=Paenibacillus amylolyticus TaxID=1451 RepID=UPI002499F6A2|nr:hypothetical protein [Paenibacillus amylolyticus]WFA82697.1 hypothetical protein OGI70_16690 [Paenibacillus amylolyticus]
MGPILFISSRYRTSYYNFSQEKITFGEPYNLNYDSGTKVSIIVSVIVAILATLGSNTKNGNVQWVPIRVEGDGRSDTDFCIIGAYNTWLFN